MDASFFENKIKESQINIMYACVCVCVYMNRYSVPFILDHHNNNKMVMQIQKKKFDILKILFMYVWLYVPRSNCYRFYYRKY